MQMNRIELAGYLGADPQTRFLASGTKVVTVRLAESYRFTTRDQKEQEHTNWHNLVFYGPLADLAEGFRKGLNIAVEGQLQVRQYTPADGHKRTHYEVIVRSTHAIARTESEPPPELQQPPQDTTNEADFYTGRA